MHAKEELDKEIVVKFFNKRGQITIFIIVALLIVLTALVFLLAPRFGLIRGDVDPNSYIEECTQEYVDEAVYKLGQAGGSIEPVHYFTYNGNNLEYLCYTNKYYETCVMQQPMLKSHVEYEITQYTRPKIEECIDSLEKELQKRGKEVESKKPEIEVNVEPGNVEVSIVSEMTVKDNEKTQRFKQFKVKSKSSLYELVMLSNSILNWEARYGDSDPLTFMLYHPDFKIEKLKQSDGTKVYLLENRDSKQQFKFATRSLSWPAGYGFSEMYIT